MDKYRILYFCFLSISLVFAIFCKKNEKGIYIFPYLLGSTLLAELLTVLLSYYKLNFYIVYHFYIPLEYGMWGSYFYIVIDKVLVKKLVRLSIVLFTITSFFCSLTIAKFQHFPSLQLNIEGLLLIIWATFAIFTIEIKHNVGIFSRPIFWVCIAVLIFYSLISSFMGVYNFISKSRADLLKILQFFLLNIPNYILYTSLSIAFICSHRIKK
jgi:hypothetical protein